LPDDPEERRLWDGISAFDTEDRARRKPLNFPFLGSDIWTLDIAEDGLIHYERTTRSRGHFTLWGDPDLILSPVVATMAVSL
jgi:hypothetical protein